MPRARGFSSRPKKKKVEEREEASSHAEDDVFDEDNANEAENLDPAIPNPASHAPAAPSPHSLKVPAAKDELQELQGMLVPGRGKSSLPGWLFGCSSR